MLLPAEAVKPFDGDGKNIQQAAGKGGAFLHYIEFKLFAFVILHESILQSFSLMHCVHLGVLSSMISIIEHRDASHSLQVIGICMPSVAICKRREFFLMARLIH